MLIFSQNVSKLIDMVYLFMKNHGIKGQFSRSSFKEMASLFGFCNVFLHIQGDFFNWPLCRLHQDKNHKNHNKKIFKKKLFCLEITQLDQWILWSWHEQAGHNIYLKKKNFSAVFIHPGQILVNFFFKWFSYLFWVKILCSVPKRNFYVFYISTLFQLQVLNFCSIDWFRFQ